MWSCSNLRLKWDARFLIPVSEVERQVAQTYAWHGMWSYSDSRWMDAELLRSASEVSMLLWTGGPRFSLKRDLHVEVRFASDDLSLVIFLTAFRTPSKIFDTPWLTGTDFKIFWTSVGLGLSMIALAIFWDALSLILSGLWFSWVYCWTAWSL